MGSFFSIVLLILLRILGFSFHTFFSALLVSASPSLPLIQGTHKASYFLRVHASAPASFPALRSQVCAWTFACQDWYPDFSQNTWLNRENCSWTWNGSHLRFSDVTNVAADSFAASSDTPSPLPSGEWICQAGSLPGLYLQRLSFSAFLPACVRICISHKLSETMWVCEKAQSSCAVCWWLCTAWRPHLWLLKVNLIDDGLTNESTDDFPL